jgi:hypothetical protein
MWLVAHLFVARTGVAASTSVSQWLRNRFWMMVEMIAVWRRRSREREELHRYLRYELKSAPNDLSRDAWIEGLKRFWEP